MLAILIAIILILLCILAVKLNEKYKYWQKKNIPYLVPTPLFGSFFDLARRKRGLCDQIIHIYDQSKAFKSPHVGFFIFNTPFLLVKDPRMIKNVLVKDFSVFMDRKTATDEKVDPIAYHTLFTSKGKVWKAARAKVSPIFTSGKMKLMFPLVEKCCKNLTNFLETKINQTVDFKEIMSKYTVDSISLCAFGFEADCLNNNDSMVYKMAKQLIDPTSFVRSFSIMCFFFNPFLVSFLRLTFADKTATKFLTGLFNQALAHRRKEKTVKNDMIDLLKGLKDTESNGGDYTFDDFKMAGHAISFFAAGSDTTGSILSFIINEITVQPKIQDRLREEINAILKKSEGLTYEDLANLKYMDMVVKEALRKYPLLSMVIREATSDYTFEETGLKIEKGVPLLIPVAGLHFDPDYYPDPEKFDPERFSEENKPNIVAFTFLPFGEGPRICIGERFAMMVVKTGLFHLLKNFEFIRCEKTEDPIEMNAAATFLQAKNGIFVEVLRVAK